MDIRVIFSLEHYECVSRYFLYMLFGIYLYAFPLCIYSRRELLGHGSYIRLALVDNVYVPKRSP